MDKNPALQLSVKRVVYPTSLRNKLVAIGYEMLFRERMNSSTYICLPSSLRKSSRMCLDTGMVCPSDMVNIPVRS